jgi:hypothetical protein
MDEEDGRLGPPPGHIIDVGPYPARCGTRQQGGAQHPDELRLLMDVTGSRAQQIGRIDVLRDALMMSLCHPLHKLHRVLQISKLRPRLNLCTLKDPTQNEVMP